MVKVGLAGLNFYRGREALDSLIKVTPSIKRNTLVIISVSVSWINLNRSCVVLNRQAKLAKFIVGETSVEECFEMVRINFQSLRIQVNCLIVIAKLARRVALGVKNLSLLLKQWVNFDRVFV